MFIRWILSVWLIGCATVSIVSAEADKPVYIKAEKEMLRQSPDGGRIGEILQSSKVKLMEEQGDWVMVEVSGWVKKSSITTNPDEIVKASRETRIHDNDFAYRDVVFGKSPGGVKISGELTNYTDIDYSAAIFTIRVYSSSENMLNTGCIIVQDFAAGQTKTFSTFIEAEFDKCNTYKISYEKGIREL
ncbi:MAG: FxLYD domain-containing protein [bacterium]